MPQNTLIVFSKNRAMQLDALLAQHGVPEGFDLLVVDTEGTEGAVISGLDLARWKPLMCIVEVHEQYPDPALRRNCDYVNARFAQAGYRKVYSDEINNVYVR